MKLDVQKLKDACDVVLKQYDDKVNRTTAAFELYAQARRAEWVEAEMPDWKKIHRIIGQRIRAGEPITSQDWGFKGKYYTVPSETASFNWQGEYFNSDRELRWANTVRELRTFLDVCATDTVTLAELKQTRYPQEFIGEVLDIAKGIETGRTERELTY